MSLTMALRSLLARIWLFTAFLALGVARLGLPTRLLPRTRLLSLPRLSCSHAVYLFQEDLSLLHLFQISPSDNSQPGGLLLDLPLVALALQSHLLLLSLPFQLLIHPHHVELFLERLERCHEGCFQP